MSVKVNYVSTLNIEETLTANAAALSDPVVTHSNFSGGLTDQDGASTPPVTKVASFNVTLSNGAATIDLTNLVGTNEAVVNGTGLRVQFLKIINDDENGNEITIEAGASNGYDGFGAAFSLTLDPGGEQLLRTNDAGSNIGTTNKTLDVSGTGAQVLHCTVVLG